MDTKTGCSVRPIAEADRAAYRSILERTSSEDRYCRFFHAVDHFDAAFVDDYVRSRPDALGFIAEEDGAALGAAHAFLLPDGRAELAIVVARDARRRGVGTALVEQIRAALAARGWPSLIAYSLSSNAAFARLARSAGMRAGIVQSGVVEWELSSHDRRTELAARASHE